MQSVWVSKVSKIAGRWDRMMSASQQGQSKVLKEQNEETIR